MVIYNTSTACLTICLDSKAELLVAVQPQVLTTLAASWNFPRSLAAFLWRGNAENIIIKLLIKLLYMDTASAVSSRMSAQKSASVLDKGTSSEACAELRLLFLLTGEPLLLPGLRGSGSSSSVENSDSLGELTGLLLRSSSISAMAASSV